MQCKCNGFATLEKSLRGPAPNQGVPRNARIVAPGVAHHVTQRGTNKQTIFFSERDRDVYLGLLRTHSKETGLRILAYCLMDNHIHLVCVPEEPDSLAVSLRRAHGRCAQYVNALKQRGGHLWQGRFYSCPLDENHLWAALRYVELNPVRAGLVTKPEAHPYSSALAHLSLSGRDGEGILDMEFWKGATRDMRWGDLLEVVETNAELRQLRRATYAGNPLGTSDFVLRWGRSSGSGESVAASSGTFPPESRKRL